MKKDFEGEGCAKNKLANKVSASIYDLIFQAGLEKRGFSSEAFKINSKNNLPQLHLDRDVKLECLHGQYRILAFKELFKLSWSGVLLIFIVLVETFNLILHQY